MLRSEGGNHRNFHNFKQLNDTNANFGNRKYLKYWERNKLILALPKNLRHAYVRIARVRPMRRSSSMVGWECRQPDAGSIWIVRFDGWLGSVPNPSKLLVSEIPNPSFTFSPPLPPPRAVSLPIGSVSPLLSQISDRNRIFSRAFLGPFYHTIGLFFALFFILDGRRKPFEFFK